MPVVYGIMGFVAYLASWWIALSLIHLWFDAKAVAKQRHQQQIDRISEYTMRDR